MTQITLIRCFTTGDYYELMETARLLHKKFKINHYQYLNEANTRSWNTQCLCLLPNLENWMLIVGDGVAQLNSTIPQICPVNFDQPANVFITMHTTLEFHFPNCSPLPIYTSSRHTIGLPHRHTNQETCRRKRTHSLSLSLSPCPFPPSTYACSCARHICIYSMTRCPGCITPHSKWQPRFPARPIGRGHI